MSGFDVEEFHFRFRQSRRQFHSPNRGKLRRHHQSLKWLVTRVVVVTAVVSLVQHHLADFHHEAAAVAAAAAAASVEAFAAVSATVFAVAVAALDDLLHQHPRRRMDAEVARHGMENWEIAASSLLLLPLQLLLLLQLKHPRIFSPLRLNHSVSLA